MRNPGFRLYHSSAMTGHDPPGTQSVRQCAAHLLQGDVILGAINHGLRNARRGRTNAPRPTPKAKEIPAACAAPPRPNAPSARHSCAADCSTGPAPNAADALGCRDERNSPRPHPDDPKEPAPTPESVSWPFQTSLPGNSLPELPPTHKMNGKCRSWRCKTKFPAPS